MAVTLCQQSSQGFHCTAGFKISVAVLSEFPFPRICPSAARAVLVQDGAGGGEGLCAFRSVIPSPGPACLRVKSGGAASKRLREGLGGRARWWEVVNLRRCSTTTTISTMRCSWSSTSSRPPTSQPVQEEGQLLMEAGYNRSNSRCSSRALCAQSLP